MLESIKNNLKELDFSSNEIQVYIALTQLGESVASKIAKKADLPRTTTIGILKNLESKNYLTSHAYRGKTYFWIESPKALEESLKNKIKIAESLNVFLSDLYRAEADFPSAEIYDTKSRVKKFIENSLISLNKKTTIFTIDTPGEGNYLKIFSEQFGNRLFELKNKKDIFTKTLIPHGSFATIDKNKLENQNIEVREMPRGVNYKSSLWIMGNKVVLFSGRYPFIVCVKHKLITDGMKSIYDFLWSVSEAKN
jgi:DNA-binding MarR family transcriptional regulator